MFDFLDFTWWQWALIGVLFVACAITAEYTLYKSKYEAIPVILARLRANGVSDAELMAVQYSLEKSSPIDVLVQRYSPENA